MSARRGDPFRLVLCPIDFSAHSRASLQYGAAVARRSKARLSVLFVNDPLLVAAAASAYDERELSRASARELRQFVSQAIGSGMFGGAPVAQGIAMGNPAREIVKAADAQRADLIVLGTEGLSGASKMFFGSTTSRVLHDAHVPVLAVPRAAPKVNVRTWPGKRVIAAIQLGPQAAADTRAAFRMASALGASLQLVHVVAPVSLPRWLGSTARTGDHQRVDEARRRLEQLCGSLGEGADVEAQVRFGSPDEQIAAAAADARAGLILVTLRPGGFFGPARGALTYKVLGGTRAPVLALPARS
jgi:nucleotide-binding universal stress UspA family protein